MTDIATLGIVVDSGQVKDAAPALDRLTDAGDRAEKSTRRLETASVALGTAYERAMEKVIEYGAAVFRSSISNALEAEQASNKLNAVLRATGYAAGLTKKELDDMADSMARATTFDDESIRNASSVMLTFRNVQGDTFRQGIKLAADMSSVLGGDLSGAAMQLGKALNDPLQGVTALSRAGVTFSAVQKDMIRDFVEVGDLASAQAIVLAELRSEFGGTAEAMNTGLTKATNDLKKSWDEMAEAMGKSETIGGNVLAVVGALDGVFKELKSAIDGTVEGADKLSAAAEAIITLFETLFVLGRNVAFVFEGIGREMGGLAAQAKALASGDLEAFAEIHRQMVEDAERARVALDAADARTLNRRSGIGTGDERDGGSAAAAAGAARQAALREAEQEADITKKNEEAIAKWREESTKAYSQVQKHAADYIESLKKETAQLGLSAIQRKMVDAALEASKLGSEKERVAVMAAASAWAAKAQAQEDATTAAKQAAEAEKQAAEQVRKNNDELDRSNGSLSAEIDSIKRRNEEIGLSAEGMNRLALARMDDAIATAEQKLRAAEKSSTDASEITLLESQVALLKEKRDLVAAGQGLQRIADESRATAEMWKSAEQSAHNAFIDIANNGESAFERIGKSLKTFVLDMLYQMTIKKWIIQIAGSMSGDGTAAALGGSGGGYSWSSGASDASTLASAYQFYTGYTSGTGTGLAGSVGNYLGGGARGAASTATANGSAYTGTASELAADGLGGVSTESTSAVSGEGAGAGWGALVIYLAWLIGEYNSKFGNTKTEGDSFQSYRNGVASSMGDRWVNGGDFFTAGGSGKLAYNGGLLDDTAANRQFLTDTGVSYEVTGAANNLIKASLTPVLESTAKTIKDLGGTLADFSMGFGVAVDPYGDARDMLRGSVADASGKVIYDNASTGDRGKTEESIAAELNRMMLAALQASDIGQLYKDAIPADLKSLTAEQSKAILEVIKTLKEASDAFEKLFAGQGGLSSEIIKLMGGLDQFKATLSGYYDNFFTEAEKHDMELANVTEQFKAANVVMPKTREEYRRIVEGIDRTTVSGQELFAKMMNLSGAFASVVPAADAAAAAVETMTESWADALARSNETDREFTLWLAQQAADLKKAWGDVAESVSKWLGDLNFSDLSPMTAQQKRDEAQAQYVEQLMKAYNGDLSAAGSITSYAEKYLASQKALTGFGGDYTAIYSAVQAQLKTLVASAERPGARPIDSQDMAALKQEVFDLKTVLARLLERGNADSDSHTAALQSTLNAGIVRLETAMRTGSIIVARA